MNSSKKAIGNCNFMYETCKLPNYYTYNGPLIYTRDA